MRSISGICKRPTDIITKISEKVAGGYADLGRLTDARASTISRFIDRLVFLFGAPGDPLPVGVPVDEGRSARQKLTTYLALYICVMVFGPWPPPTSSGSERAKYLRTIIVAVVEASLQLMKTNAHSEFDHSTQTNF